MSKKQLTKDGEPLSVVDQWLFWTCWNRARQTGGTLTNEWMRKAEVIVSDEPAELDELLHDLLIKVCLEKKGRTKTIAFPAFLYGTVKENGDIYLELSEEFKNAADI